MEKVTNFFGLFRKEKITYKNLRTINLVAAGLHAGQAILVVALSGAASGIFPVTTNYLALDAIASAASGQPVLSTATHYLFDIKLAYLVAAFFLMSAVAHYLVANEYRKKYEAGLKKGISKFRWVEYAFSASTMMVGIALLSGISDISSLFMIFALTAIMNLMGLVMEVHNQTTKKTNWLSFKIGVIAELAAWAAIAIYLGGAIFYGSGVPTFVYFIYGSLFVFFSCFAVNMYLQYKQIGKWKNYIYGERVYIILSLVAKSALAWQVFAGALRP